MPEQRRFGTLQGRLLAAFLGVAVLAIAVLAGLILWTSRSDVNTLVNRQRQATLRDTAAALADAYREAGGWTKADLHGARALATAAGATLEVMNASGAIVFAPGQGIGRGRSAGAGTGQPLRPSELGQAKSEAVVVSGKRVGTATLSFPKNTLPPAEKQLRRALTTTTLIGAGVAAAVALLVGALVAGWIRRPLRRLIEAVRRLEAGDRGARANLSAPGELGELAHAVDRMASSLEREDDLRKALVSDVAHEIRTPVTILQAECESMLDGIAEPTPERISSLHDEVLRLGRLVEDLEALAHAEAAGLLLERHRVDLAEIARATAQLYQAQFGAADVELDLHLTPAFVEGDPTRLGQVVRNLLANALKFTAPGGRVDLGVETVRGETRLTVTDTGQGIPEQELAHVFERFWRGAGARVSTEGSGVGLAVASELVNAHGGRIEVESREGEGSTFSVLIPGS
jgi:two-component system sensor histidine kinase BaeS